MPSLPVPSLPVPSLIAKTPCDGLLPLTQGDLVLSEVVPGAITSLAPLKGQDAAASTLLKECHGMKFPNPGRTSGRARARAIWMGLGQAFLIGPAPDPALTAHFALTGQSDGWALMRLDGAEAAAALGFLCPLDLRPAHFKRGHTARTLLGHMPVSITRLGPASFEIMTFRSMANSAVAELHEAMKTAIALG